MNEVLPKNRKKKKKNHRHTPSYLFFKKSLSKKDPKEMMT